MMIARGDLVEVLPTTRIRSVNPSTAYFGNGAAPGTNPRTVTILKSRYNYHERAMA